MMRKREAAVMRVLNATNKVLGSMRFVERNIVRDFTRRLYNRHGEIRKVKWIGRRNAPDSVILLRGWHPLVEFKATGLKATAAQHREHVRLRNAGFEVWVVNGEQSMDDFFYHYDIHHKRKKT